MEIKLNLEGEKLAGMVNEKIMQENEELKKRLEEFKAKKRKKINIRMKPRAGRVFAAATIGGKKLKVYKKKPVEDVRTGYIDSVPRNIEEIVEKKVREALKNRSKIRVVFKAKQCTKMPALKEEMPTMPVPLPAEERSRKTIRIAVHKPAAAGSMPISARPSAGVPLVPSKLPAEEEGKIIRVHTARGVVRLHLKPLPKKEADIKTGMIGPSIAMEPLLQLFNVMMQRPEGDEERPKIDGIKLPEI